MQKTKLVIASVLKPVDDTRMYEKFGFSLSQTNKYDINIIGFYTKNIPDDRSITFLRLYNFSRLSFKRLLAPLRCFRAFIKLKPQILIINTHELLIVAGLYKILFGCHLLYDIQENYYRNILYTKAFPFLIKPLIASYVRGKEYFSMLFVDHYFLAERQYEKEFSFSKGKSTVIENKYRPPIQPLKRNLNQDQINLLFSGTLAESTGVFYAIDIAKKMHEIDPRVSLKIIGHCSIPSTLIKLQKLVDDHDFITLIGGKKLVPHGDILQAIATSHFGIIYYPTNYSTMNTTPTKLYEYLGSRLPIILQNHEPWVELATHHDGCIVLENDNQIDEVFMHKLSTLQFYQKRSNQDILWESEGQKLVSIIDKIIS